MTRNSDAKTSNSVTPANLKHLRPAKAFKLINTVITIELDLSTFPPNTFPSVREFFLLCTPEGKHDDGILGDNYIFVCRIN